MTLPLVIAGLFILLILVYALVRYAVSREIRDSNGHSWVYPRTDLTPYDPTCSRCFGPASKVAPDPCTPWGQTPRLSDSMYLKPDRRETGRTTVKTGT